MVNSDSEDQEGSAGAGSERMDVSSGFPVADPIDVIRRLFAEASAPRTQLHLYDQVFGQWDGGDIGSEAWAQHLLEYSEIAEFDRKLTALKQEVEEKAAALLDEKVSAEKREERIRDLELSLEKLNDTHRLSYLLSRVGEAGQKLLLESEEFRDQFVSGVPHLAYVLSVDIRKSTELMLKAREPHLFAAFIRDLADNLRRIVLANSGVFDKFTGDGILAVFPEFYSGADAGYLALTTAIECHQAFEECYRRNRSTFVSVLQNTGLGIGLDFGRVHMVQVGEDFTVVGTPVVYACRMAGATAGRTFANQPAYEQLVANFSEFCLFEETEIEIKHEGPTLAYSVSLPEKSASATDNAR